METTLTVNRLADLAGITHGTARRRLAAAGAKPESDGRYSLRSVLQAWEKFAAGRSGELDEREAKIRLANLKIEKETLQLARANGDLVERKGYEQFTEAMMKIMWASIQSLNLGEAPEKQLSAAYNQAMHEAVGLLPKDFWRPAMTREEQKQHDIEEASPKNSPLNSQSGVDLL